MKKDKKKHPVNPDDYSEKIADHPSGVVEYIENTRHGVTPYKGRKFQIPSDHPLTRNTLPNELVTPLDPNRHEIYFKQTIKEYRTLAYKCYRQFGLPHGHKQWVCTNIKSPLDVISYQPLDPEKDLNYYLESFRAFEMLYDYDLPTKFGYEPRSAPIEAGRLLKELWMLEATLNRIQPRTARGTEKSALEKSPSISEMFELANQVAIVERTYLDFAQTYLPWPYDPAGRTLLRICEDSLSLNEAQRKPQAKWLIALKEFIEMKTAEYKKNRKNG